ncbi:unnamed protein product, partial [Closterium sp. NIES-54]
AHRTAAQTRVAPLPALPAHSARPPRLHPVQCIPPVGALLCHRGLRRALPQRPPGRVEVCVGGGWQCEQHGQQGRGQGGVWRAQRVGNLRCRAHQ